jgi:methylglutaconyl-CoA hydratase
MIQKYQTILVHRENRVLTVTLNRPEKRNALNEKMIVELQTVFERYRQDFSLDGVILTGSGKAFCAGADLAYLKSLQNKSIEENYRDSVNLKNMLWTIYTFPKPTLALVNGPAVAGGCGLMNVCDVAIAGQQAVFAYPEVRIGFVAAIVSVFLVRAIGLQQAKSILLTGETLDAKKAQALGLVSQVVEEHALRQAGIEFFLNIKQNSGQAVRQTKALLLKQWGESLHANLEEACHFNTESRQTKDFKEGLSAFIEKRKPVWSA